MLQQTIRSAEKERTTGVAEFDLRAIKSGGAHTGGKMLNYTKHMVERQQRGSPLARITKAPQLRGPLNQMFHTGYSTPNYDDEMSLYEEPTNTKHVVNRRMLAIHKSYPRLGRHELAILFKENPQNLNTCRFEFSRDSMQCNPMFIVPPAILNSVLLAIQQEESIRYPDLYRQRVPDDYWKDYAIDGVIEHESAMPHHKMLPTLPCSVSDIVACSTSVLVDDQGGGGSGGGERLVTMITRGPQHIYNYWGACVRPGAKLYAVIKKFEPSDYASQGSFHCLLKMNNAVMPNPSAQLRPYQIGFFALPYGGPVPDEHKRYYDEQGELRTDGLIIYIGEVTEVSADHTFKPLQTPLKPFTTLPETPLSLAPSMTLLNTGSHYSTSLSTAMCPPLIKIMLNCDNGISPV